MGTWNPSAAFGVGDKVPVGLGNAFGAWTAYTPTLTATTTNPTLGTGSTASGRYAEIDRVVFGTFDITFGSSGVAAGSGTYEISAPVNIYSSRPANAPLGRAMLFDSSGSVAAYFDLISDYDTFRIRYAATWPTGSLTYVNDSTPWTWAAGDYIRGAFFYESQS
jgi:hypothetical protein